MIGPNDSSIAMNMWSPTSVNTVGSKKKPGGRHLTSHLSYQRWSSLNCQASVQIALPYLVAALVCHHRPVWLPPWRHSDSTLPVCLDGLCGSEGRGLWSGPMDHRSSSSWPPQPERQDIQIRRPQKVKLHPVDPKTLVKSTCKGFYD